MTYLEAKSFLDSLVNYELKLKNIGRGGFSLDGVRLALEHLGNPQQKLKFIHVAGTKGKGSTCLFAAFILRSAGYRTGLFTSPHFYEPTERIRILQGPVAAVVSDPFEGQITRREFARIVSQIKPVIEKMAKSGNPLTYFEAIMVLAVQYFAWKKVDCVVLETGLGGRLDATNVFKTLVCGITPVSLDHMQQLGHTISKIAYEKSAIIKDKCQKVVIASQAPEARKIILKRCRKFCITPIEVGKDISIKMIRTSIKGSTFSLRSPQDRYSFLRISLPGAHQVFNAAAAVGMVESLAEFGFDVRPADIRKGLKEAVWPGRFEMVAQRPDIILDCAHNPNSTGELVRTLKPILKGKQFIAVLGISEDKDIAGICRVLEPAAQKVILTNARHPRAYVFGEKDRNIFKDQKKVIVTDNLQAALSHARDLADRGSIIVVTGSIFLVAQARKILWPS